MKVEIYKNLVFDQIFPQQNQKIHETSRVAEKEGQREIKPKINKELLKELAKQYKEFLSLFDLEAKIVYDKKYDTLVVQVIRKDTGELIRQIPPEELLKLSKKIHELVGLILEEKV